MADGQVRIDVLANTGDAKKKADELKKKFADVGSDDGNGSGKLESLKSGAGKVAAAVGKAAAAAAVAAGTALAATVTKATQAYSEYEQLSGGVEKLFGDAASKVQGYAQQAFKTAGLSTNAYMEQVTGLASALKQSFGGDAVKAADAANMAIVDMSDNANVFGSNIRDVQNAYAGFAKQNYTMLDNLKLGYGGTQEEMKRLIADANAYEKANGRAGDLSIEKLGDVVQAIHDVQEQQGIAGDTAEEAGSTVQGSLMMVQGAWENLLTAIGSGDGIEKAVQDLVESVGTFAKNVVPVVTRALTGAMQALPDVIRSAVSTLGPAAMELGHAVATQLVDAFNGAVAVTGLKLPKLDVSDVEGAVGHVVELARTFANSFSSGFSSAVGGTKGLSDTLRGIADAFGKLLDAAKPAADAISGPLAEGLGKLAGISLKATEAALKGIASALRVLSDNAGTVGSAIAALAGGFATMKIAGTVATGVKTLSIALSGVKTAMSMIKSFQGLAAVLSTLAGGPVALVIGLIAALAIGLVTLYNTNETFRNGVNAAWNAICQVVTTVATAIATFFTSTIPSALSSFGSMLAGLPATIGGVLASIPGALAGLLTTIGTAVLGFLAQLPTMLATGLGFIIGFVVGIIAQTVSVVASGLAALPGVVSGIVQAIVTFFTVTIPAGIQAMLAFFASLPGSIASFLAGAVAAIAGFVSSAISGAARAGSGFISGVSSFFSQLPGRIAGFVSGAVGALAGFVSGAASKAASAGSSFMRGIQSGFNSAVSFVRGIPGKMAGALSGAAGALVSSGRALINGFKRGIEKGLSAAKSAVSNGLASIRKLFPFSPAKEGPFSGHGYTTWSGRALMRDFAKSISGMAPQAVDAAEGAIAAVQSRFSAASLSVATPSVEYAPRPADVVATVTSTPDGTTAGALRRACDLLAEIADGDGRGAVTIDGLVVNDGSAIRGEVLSLIDRLVTLGGMNNG